MRVLSFDNLNSVLKAGMLSVILIAGLFMRLEAQDTLRFYNPSFEDRSKCCQPPEGWGNIHDYANTPPDVQPNGGFGVKRPAYHGATYLGMVTREDGTFETVFQKLKSPILADNCYTISVYLSKSVEYSSGTRARPNMVSEFLSPTVLQILAGDHPSDPELEILNTSTPVEHHEWIEYVFEFIPSKDFSYIFFSAYYPEGTEYFTNGHILVDHLSDITLCTEKTD